MIDRQEQQSGSDWLALRKEVIAVLAHFGTAYEAGRGDYWVSEDDTDQDMVQVELQNLHLLRHDVIRSLQLLLARRPDWVIAVRVEAINTSGKRAGMGLFVCPDKIVDDLRRELLPPSFRTMRFDQCSREWAPSP
jgi:hypothetical protein